MSSNNNAKSLPTHRVFAVTGKGKKKFWKPIGALWAHKDGKGFSLALEYLPLNGAQTVARVIEEKPEAEGEPATDTVA